MNNRKVPLRKCVATQEMKPKRELVRIVRSKEGEVSIDLTGKKSGRGAYLSRDKEAILLAQKKNILEHQLKAKIDGSLYEELLALVEQP
ncbi:YlxR family protein [Ectobacillus sp. JY-23]|uniref:RNase P modulator RnpM n=1 Tax=Ectobacillus sp. JY-23 TaxID=2933872 RepID=UPI001FF643F1|nr:YlxR family protein [Ectobacillus sp. JY-23]UOY93637.1 YlxR family protein [Ectobacillus sp. JY-23]